MFLAIGLGYLVGQIRIGGFSLGVGAVLFVGLAIGAFAPKASIVGPIGLVGLIMFLYGIGILYGREFFEGMIGTAGRKYNLLALVGCLAGLLVALGLGQAFGIKIGHTLGIYAGSMTSTATLQASLDVMKTSDPSIGYSVAYPFGVIGPILCIYFMTRMVQPKFPPKSHNFHMGEITLGDSYAGKTLRPAQKELPDGVQVTIVRQDGGNVVPSDDLVLAAGRWSHGRRRSDKRRSPRRRQRSEIWSPVGSRRIDLRSTISGSLLERPTWSACRWRSWRCRAASRIAACQAIRRRHRADAQSDSGIRRPRRGPDSTGPKGRVRKHFGDTVKSAAEFSYVSLGIGMVLGVLLGLIPIPIPGVGTVTLGIGGGPLIVALILGKLRRTGPMLWTMPLPANIVLRNYGLAIFLAAVGINAGPAIRGRRCRRRG